MGQEARCLARVSDSLSALRFVISKASRRPAAPPAAKPLIGRFRSS